jgi:hypothetical protein
MICYDLKTVIYPYLDDDTELKLGHFRSWNTIRLHTRYKLVNSIQTKNWICDYVTPLMLDNLIDFENLSKYCAENIKLSTLKASIILHGHSFCQINDVYDFIKLYIYYINKYSINHGVNINQRLELDHKSYDHKCRKITINISLDNYQSLNNLGDLNNVKMSINKIFKYYQLHNKLNCIDFDFGGTRGIWVLIIIFSINTGNEYNSICDKIQNIVKNWKPQNN